MRDAAAHGALHSTADGRIVSDRSRTDRRVSAVEVSGEVLRFEVERLTGGNTGAVEIEVYARGDA